MAKSKNKKTKHKQTDSARIKHAENRNQPDFLNESRKFDELRVESKQMQKMVEHLPAGAVYISSDKLTMNRAVEKLTGYTGDEINTLDLWFNKLYGDEADKMRHIYDEYRTAGFVESSPPIASKCKDGSIRYIEYSGYLFDHQEIWLLHDVTKRTQYEKQLTTSEERLRSIMDNASESIIVINETGEITDYNAASEKLFGYKVDEAIGKNVSMLMPPPYREQHDNYLANYIKTGKTLYGNNKRELPGLHKDGHIIPLSLTIATIDHLGLFCGIIRDLSQQKALEKEVADICTMEQERIGQDIHDGLGQQLTGLGMMISSLKRELVRENIPKNERLDEIISYLQKAAEDSRTLSRGLAPMSIETLGLEDAIKLLARDVKQTSGINCTFESPQPVNINDSTVTIQIYRIIQEAVNNAVKHANAKNIRIYLKNTDYFELRVCDDGKGFEITEDKIRDNLGLRVMRYRAGIIGCNLHFNTTPEGTTVNCKHLYGTIK